MYIEGGIFSFILVFDVKIGSRTLTAAERIRINKEKRRQKRVQQTTEWRKLKQKAQNDIGPRQKCHKDGISMRSRAPVIIES